MGSNVSRCGAVKDRYQVYNSRTNMWTVYDSNTDKPLRQREGEPYKGIRKVVVR